MDLLRKRKNGFTLIEMVVSIGIFSVLVIAAVGVMIEVSRAQSKAAAIQAIQDNIRFSLELMTKEMRTGANYRAISNCGSIGNGFQFTSYNQPGGPQERFYYLSDTDGDGAPDAIKRVAMVSAGVIDCTQAQQFTAREVVVSQLRFDAHGTALGPNDGQPWVTVSIRAASRDPKPGTATSMNVQTTVAQRLRDQ